MLDAARERFSGPIRDIGLFHSPLLMRLASLFVGVLACAAYLPSFGGPFLYDDINQIENNRALDVLWPPTTPMFDGPMFPRRPLAYYSFAVDRAVHGGSPTGYRVVNLVIHLINGVLCWKIGALLLLKLPRTTVKAPETTAAFAAAIWLLHPLNTQPVAYIYQRMELLGGSAGLATLLCFLASIASRHPSLWRTAAVICCGTGMLCKETVVAAPMTVLLIDASMTGSASSGFIASITAALRSRFRFYFALFATIAIAVAVVWVQRGAYPELSTGTWSPLAYAATQPWAVARYLSLAICPSGQCFDYGWKAVQSPMVSAIGVAGAAIALGGALAIWNQRRGLALSGLLFLSLLAPTSSLLPVNDIVVEHRMYLPLFVVALTATVVANEIWQRVSPPVAGRGTGIARCMATCIMLALAGATASRARVYGSLLALWQDTAAKAPANPRAHLWHGIALAEQDRSSEAFEAFGRTIALAPKSRETARAHAWRAAILGRAGHPAGALVEATVAVRLDPDEPLGWANLGRTCVELGRYEQAIVACQRALSLDPTLTPTAALLDQLEAMIQSAPPGDSR